MVIVWLQLENAFNLNEMKDSEMSGTGDLIIDDLGVALGRRG